MVHDPRPYDGRVAADPKAMLNDFDEDDLFAIKYLFYVGTSIYVLSSALPPFSSWDCILTTKSGTNDPAVSETIEIKSHIPSDANSPWILRIRPIHREGVKILRIAVRSGNLAEPGGIPMDHAGLKFRDQHRAGGCFQDFKDIEIQFSDKEG
jgi:hypothetical protein